MDTRETPQTSRDMARSIRRCRDMLHQVQKENRDLTQKVQRSQAAEKQNLAQAAEERIAHEGFKERAQAQITILTGENESLRIINERLGKSIMASREEAAEQRLVIDQLSQELHDLDKRVDALATYTSNLDKFNKAVDRVHEAEATFNDRLQVLRGSFEMHGDAAKLEDEIKTHVREIEYLKNDVKALNAEVYQHEEKATEHHRRGVMLVDAQQQNAELRLRNADLEALVENLLPQCRFPFNVRAFLRQRARERGMPYGFDSPSHFPSDDFDEVVEN